MPTREKFFTGSLCVREEWQNIVLCLIINTLRKNIVSHKSSPAKNTFSCFLLIFFLVDLAVTLNSIKLFSEMFFPTCFCHLDVAEYSGIFKNL